MKKISCFNFYIKILKAYKKQKKFSVFRNPKENILYLYIDSFKNHLSNNINKYFLIGDFHNEKIIKIIPNEIYYYKYSKVIDEKYFNIINYSLNSSKKYYKSYKLLFNKALNLINKNILKKVVISRCKKIKFKKINLKLSFINLLNSYPESFVNIWHDPTYGLWIGATPELLFNKKNNFLKSYVLAGTLFNKIKTWDFKELNEHYIVLNYIYKVLNNNFDGKIILNRTSTIKTGDIKHLKTIVNFNFYNKNPDIKKIINILHPTPAICGVPKNLAKKFIIKNEINNRKFYCGYIGFIYKNNAKIYVNLRCSKVEKKHISLYAGAGITYNSILNKEWIEIEKKIQNILSNIKII